ncbi:TIGR04283 family arsenosugar biosynthesis glycosyltransferase [Chamaesiphon sp.]|uniref:TIGR04283 family arsenosugar biosynthesis glycosyltransferase n=1 Tax=Chamaesiphon sp. TaxID=2814140 RepID=UPI0035946AB8
MNSIEKISIIIPVLNEIKPIAATLASIDPSTNIEVIVVDGGSIDGTLDLVQSLGIEVLSSPAGRAIQMNAGALVATGEILLFLHADTLLPPEFDMMIRTVMQSPNSAGSKVAVAGAFELQIDDPAIGLRSIERGVNWRSRFLQLPYGDQAIFLRSKTFDRIGGFLELPIMEDFDLVRRLKQLGHITIIPVPVITSARRWLKKGILKTTLINQVIIIAYLLGVSPHQLMRWYRKDSP